MRQLQRVLKRLRRSRGLLLFIFLTAAMAIACLQQSRSGSPSSHATPVIHDGLDAGSTVTTSRRLHATTATHRPVLARPPSQLHSFLVLDTDDYSGSRTLKKLEPYLAPYREHPEAVAITLITGVAATSLAGQFSIAATALPAVVYLPPMWQSGAHFTEAAALSLGRDAADAADFSNWVKSKARMTLLLMNDWDDLDVCFYFVTNDERKDEVLIGCTATQVELWQEVALLDTFIARNKTSKAKLAQHVALFAGLFVVQPPGFCKYLANSSCDMAKLQYPTDQAIYARREFSEKVRLQSLKEQSGRTKHYTGVGFEKRRAPDELIQALRGYLNSTWDNLMRETRNPELTFANSYDAPGLKATLPEVGPLKPRLFKVVQGLLEKWIGGNVPLQSTAMYGIRVYTRNSTLAMHIDRPDTHIVSSIVNVDQSVEEPWPLHILDHAGKLHNVTMQPGDLIMYEGSACGHGRVQPLKGRFFANVFIHFKPV